MQMQMQICCLDSLPKDNRAARYTIYSIPPLHPSPCPSHPLILAGSSLAGLELVEIPSANVQAALVLVHALPEVTDLGLASATLAVVVGGLVLLGKIGGCGLLLSGLRG